MNVVYSTSIEVIIVIIKALKVLCILLFNKFSHVSQGLTSLILTLMYNKPLLRARAMVDKKFIAKVIYCIDDRLYQWLKQCARATYVKDTPTALTNVGDIFVYVFTNEFVYLLTTMSSTTNEIVIRRSANIQIAF